MNMSRNKNLDNSFSDMECHYLGQFFHWYTKNLSKMFATKPFDIKQIHCLKFFKITILYTTNNLDEYTKFYLAKIAFISN